MIEVKMPWELLDIEVVRIKRRRDLPDRYSLPQKCKGGPLDRYLINQSDDNSKCSDFS